MTVLVVYTCVPVAFVSKVTKHMYIMRNVRCTLAIVKFDQRRGITYVSEARPVGFWTVLTVLPLESVHMYVRGVNAQPEVVKVMLPPQSTTVASTIARVHVRTT